MKKLLITFFLTFSAYANMKPYVAIKSALVDPEVRDRGLSKDMNTTYGIAASGGVYFPFMIAYAKADLEMTYRHGMKVKVASSKMNLMTVMLNSKILMPIGPVFLYAGPGIGFSVPSDDDDDLGFSYQMEAGVEKLVTENFGISLSYKYMAFLGDGFTFYAHEALASVSYYF